MLTVDEYRNRVVLYEQGIIDHPMKSGDFLHYRFFGDKVCFRKDIPIPEEMVTTHQVHFARMQGIGVVSWCEAGRFLNGYVECMAFNEAIFNPVGTFAFRDVNTATRNARRVLFHTFGELRNKVGNIFVYHRVFQDWMREEGCFDDIALRIAINNELKREIKDEFAEYALSAEDKLENILESYSWVLDNYEEAVDCGDMEDLYEEFFDSTMQRYANNGLMSHSFLRGDEPLTTVLAERINALSEYICKYSLYEGCTDDTIMACVARPLYALDLLKRGADISVLSRQS